MPDSDETLLAAVDRLDDAAAALRQSGWHSDQMAALLRLITHVQNRIMVVAGEKPNRRTASRFVVVNPIH